MSRVVLVLHLQVWTLALSHPPMYQVMVVVVMFPFLEHQGYASQSAGYSTTSSQTLIL